jgi:hypothetical protein
MSITVTLECDRVGCGDMFEEDDIFPNSMTFGELISQCGWVYDYVGLERVLHCPAHAESKAGVK